MVFNHDRPSYRLVEMAQIVNKTAAEVANVAEETWFTRYPYPQKVILNRGK